MQKGYVRVSIIVTIVLFPFLMEWLSELDNNRAMIWFLFHQLYHLPFGSWLGEPFYKPDSDVSYWVQIPWRFLAPVVYVTIYFFLIRLKNSLLVK